MSEEGIIPARAAYEAAMRAIAEQTGLNIDFPALEPMIAWDEQTETARAAWDAAAQAAITAGTGRILAELTTARQERDVYQRAASIACQERDEARADADRLRPLEAEAQHAHAEATRLRERLRHAGEIVVADDREELEG